MRPAACLLLALALAGCGGGGGSSEEAEPTNGVIWPAPPNPLELTREAGLTPETREFVNVHTHAHLDMFLNGGRIVVPGGIGIDIENPAVKSGELPDGSMSYGGIDPPCKEPCISPLHTHSADGVLHTEAKKNQFHTLGEFFTEWDVKLDESCVGNYCRPKTPVAVYVNGEKQAGNPADIRLGNLDEIAVVIGSPPDEIPERWAG
jgi:hypothetical protein